MSLTDQVNSQLMVIRQHVTASQTSGLTVTLPYAPEQSSLLLVLHNGKQHTGFTVSGQNVAITGTFAINDAIDVFYPKALWAGLASLAAKGQSEGASRTVEMAQVDVVETFTLWLRTALSGILGSLESRLGDIETRLRGVETRLTTVESDLQTHQHAPTTPAA